jgi:hypothetical protein
MKTFTVNGKEFKKKAGMSKKVKVSDAVSNANPLSRLGFGILAYIDILYYMIWAFGLYTIIMIPTMFFYSNGTSYANVGSTAI